MKFSVKTASNTHILAHTLAHTLALALAALSGCGVFSDVHDMHDDMKGLRVDIKAMSTQMTGLNTSIDGMNTKMTDMGTHIEGVDNKMTSMDGHVTGMSTSVTTMDGHLAATTTEIVKMDGKISDLTGYLKTMLDKITTLTDAFAPMIETMKAVDQDMKLMTTQVSNMDKNVGSMKDSMGGMDAKLQQMLTKVSNLSDQLQPLIVSLTSVDADLKTVTTQMNTMNKNIVDMHADMATMRDKIVGLSDQITEMVKVVSGLGTYMEHMSGQMDQMNSTIQTQMTGMYTAIKTMQVSLVQMFSGLRMVLTRDARQDSLTAMEGATKPEIKLAYAAEFLASQEYQGFNATIEADDYRQKLLKMSVDDFFLKMPVPNHDDVTVTDQSSESQDRYAISAALDYVNIAQIEGLKDSSLPVMSMMSMIEDGLSIKDNDTLKPYQASVRSNAPNAIYYLRLRQNFLKGIAYNLAAAGESGNSPTKIKSIWNVIKSSAPRFFHLTVNTSLDSQNVEQIAVITNVLILAADTEKFLVDNHIDPKIDKTMSKLLQNLKIDSGKFNSVGTELNDFNTALQTINTLDNQN